MKVGILYSGGKDSTFALDFARQKGWDVRYLLSVKPSRTDCFLFHFATVEHTGHLAEMLGIKHTLVGCDVAEPEKEAQIVRDAVLNEEKVDALVLGGVGLQETQLKSIQKALMPEGIEVFAAHAGEDHVQVMRDLVKKGYKFMITQVAADGFNAGWLGKVLAGESDVDEIVALAEKHGFHAGAEGGHYDTLTVDGPVFTHALDVRIVEKKMETECSGHIIAEVTPVKKMVENASRH